MFYLKKINAILISSLVILILGIFVHNLINTKVIQIIDIEKCPACYGFSMCKNIYDDQISFEYRDFYEFFNNILNIKNVYYGKFNETKVVLKKLAHQSELDAFDEMICTSDILQELCYKKTKFKGKKVNFSELIISEITKSELDPNTKLRLCPTISNLKELFLKSFQENIFEVEDYKFLWSLIKINPEPIILQVLSPTNGWPTPKYFGACGRLIVEEYIGLPLSSFIDVSWIRRARISSSLLKAAYMFTFSHSKFSFYLTDISMDNIAVNNQDQAIFIDLENIIIVDTNPPSEVLNTRKTWDILYINDIEVDCQDCFVFSPLDICNHKISDHNYYAICQHILTHGDTMNNYNQGFLHDPPDSILKQYPTLTKLIKQCLVPDTPYLRIQHGIELQRLLDTIINKK